MKFLLSLAISLLWFQSIASANQYGLRLGYFNPDDSIVKSIYNPNILRWEGAAEQKSTLNPNMFWTERLSYSLMKNRVSALETQTKLYTLGMGFKQFLCGSDNCPDLATYCGAGINAIMLDIKVENEVNESSAGSSDEYSGGYYWELGISYKAFSDMYLDISINEQKILKQKTGNISLNGSYFVFGVTYVTGS